MKSKALRPLAFAAFAVVVAALFLLDWEGVEFVDLHPRGPAAEWADSNAGTTERAEEFPTPAGRRADPAAADRSPLPPPSPGTDAARIAPTPRVVHLHGRVVDGLGVGISACSVGLERRAGMPGLGIEPHDDGGRSARSGVEGNFEFSAVPTGRFTLTIRHPQFPAWLASLHLPTGSSGTIDLGELALRSESGLRVRVFGAAEGVPVADARLTLEPALLDPFLGSFGRRALVRTATTDQMGRAAIYGVPDGEYRLRVEATGRGTTEMRVIRDSATDSPDQVHEVRLSTGELLRGRVVDAEGRPVPGVLVLGVPAVDSPAEWTERTASDGSFRLLGLPRGSCTLRAWTFDDDLRLASEPRTVEVPREAPVELRLPRASSLRGVVRDALDGAPIRDATVTAIPLEGTPVRAGEFAPLRTRTDGEGRFTIDGLSPGRTRLQVSSERYATALTAPQVPSEAPGPVLEVVLQPGVRVRGRVLDAAGSAMAHAVLQTVPASFDGTALSILATALGRGAQPRAPAARWSTRVQQDGSFDAVLPVGVGERFRLRVLAEDCAPWISPILVGPAAATARRSGLDLGDLVVARAGRIEGTCRDQDGRSMVGAVVIAEPAPRPDQTPSGTGDGSPRPLREGARTRTDANGHYILTGLAPGAYDIWAASAGSSIEPRALRPRGSPTGSASGGIRSIGGYRLDEPSIGPRRTQRFEGVEVQSQRVTPRDLDFAATTPVESSGSSADDPASREGAPR